jgi:hypothetical protein
MANTKTPITIDDVEYQFEDMTQEQQMLVNHVADLDRKLGSARFNVDQLQVRRCLTAVLSLLTQLSRYACRAAMTWMRPS